MHSFFVGAAEISLLLCIIMIVVLVLQHASDEQKVLILAVCAGLREFFLPLFPICLSCNMF